MIINKKVCQNCGHKINKDSVYCSHCGKKCNEIPPIPKFQNKQSVKNDFSSMNEEERIEIIKDILFKGFNIFLLIPAFIFILYGIINEHSFLEGTAFILWGLIMIKPIRTFINTHITKAVSKGLVYSFFIVFPFLILGLSYSESENNVIKVIDIKEQENIKEELKNKEKQESKTDKKKDSEKESTSDKKKDAKVQSKNKQKKDTKQESEPNKNVIKEGSTIYIEDILENPQLYAGKELRIKGMLPQVAMQTSDGRFIPVMNTYDIKNYIELRGATPDFGGCEALVTGYVFLENGTPIIKPHSYEALGPTTSVTVPPGYGTYDINSLGTYITNFDMVIRVTSEYSSSQTGNLKKGEVVDIIDIVDNREYNGGVWGKITSGQWVCLEDHDNIYLSKY